MQSNPTSYPQNQKKKKDIHKSWQMFTKDTQGQPFGIDIGIKHGFSMH